MAKYNNIQQTTYRIINNYRINGVAATNEPAMGEKGYRL
jgi:hypothetical protein